MATPKETLQARAEELGLETEGTIAQLTEWIAAADAEDKDAVETPPEVADTEPPPAPVIAEALPDEPAAPPSTTPKRAPVAAGTLETYQVLSAFWLMTGKGPKLAQRNGKVRLTEKQAKKYLKHNNIVAMAA